MCDKVLFISMKLINKIDDSFGAGERIINVVEVSDRLYADVMHIVSENYFYLMQYEGGELYGKNGEYSPCSKEKELEIINFVKNWKG